MRQSLHPLAPISLALEKTIGSTLVTAIEADRPLPPYSRSMMDGIAFRSTGFSGGETLNIAGLHAAGNPPPSSLPDGHAWEIMTGAVVPDDCDTIVPYEELRWDKGEEKRVHLPASFESGRFIHRAGSDSPSGDTLVKAGTIINAPEIAIAASVGLIELQVTRKPRIGLLTTGDEAVAPGTSPEPWQIRRSNGPALAASLAANGLHIAFHQHAPDDEIELGRLLDLALGSVDLLIISGGINTYPAEIEQVLALHPAVRDVAVAGLPDETWGELVAAFLVGPGPDDIPDLEAFCRTRLASFKVPRVWHFLEDLPRNPTGKVLKRQLRQTYVPNQAT